MQHKWRHWLTWRQGPQPPRAPTVFTVTWEECRRKCRTCVALPKVQRGVQAWRPLPTWRQGARWRGRTWRQNVASLLHAASGSQVASKPGRGVKMRRLWPTWRQGARWRRMPTWRQGVKMWRHLPTWRQGATWRRRTWRENVASGAIDLRGVTGRGVKTWRHEASPPGTCLQNVSSVVGRYVHPHRQPPCLHIYLQMYIYIYM